MNRRSSRAITLFEDGRFPNLVVTPDGTLIAVWGHQRVVSRTSRDGGETWGPEIVIDPSAIQGGGALVNEATGEVLAFTHPEHPPRDPEPTAPRRVFRSADNGVSWQPIDATFEPDVKGYVPALHMSEKGITLRHGPHGGRLIRPARVYIGAGQRAETHTGYNTAIFSDDGGRTWRASAPFPEDGTGEGAIVELADGELLYNSRKQYFEDGQTPHAKRLHARSRDGGQTWVDLTLVDALPDGPRYRGEEHRGSNYNGHYGLMAGFERLPDPDRDVLLYTSTDEAGHERRNLTVWASYDGGRSWPVKRSIFDGPCAYSSIVAGRPGTPSEGWFYVLFEGGEKDCYEGGRLARFNLAWVEAGEPPSPENQTPGTRQD